MHQFIDEPDFAEDEETRKLQEADDREGLQERYERYKRHQEYVQKTNAAA